MDELTVKARPAPTAQRPLLGTTVLIVEDSRFASEAVRLLCLRSGARIRRADCLASAERHLGTYRPEVAIVDLGLPDGSGLALIGTLAQAAARPDVILATSGLDRSEAEAASQAAGADGFLAKPIEGLAAFQEAILAHLPPDRRPRGLRELSGDTVHPDRLALDEDLAQAERMLLEDGVPPVFVARFLQGLARTGHDVDLLAQARSLVPGQPDIRDRLMAMIAARRGEKRVV